MHRQKKMNHRIFMVMVVGMAIFMISGCARKELQVKDTSFEKWRTMAQQNTGHSPVARKRHMETEGVEGSQSASEDIRQSDDLKAADTGEVVKPEKEKAARPLPSKKITMKMRNVDIAVLLRAMAKIADQNIVINDTVKGNVNINVVDAPWDESFMSVLSANGLTYTWVGSILRIMTLDDMKHDVELLKAEQSKKAAVEEFALSQIEIKSKVERFEPLVTKVLHVDYADPEILRNNLWEFLKVTTSESGKNDNPSQIENDSTNGVRGAILVDKHTNSLMIQATRNDIERLMPLIEKLDRPTPQILIKAEIVETSSDVARDLGVQWGGGIHNTSSGNNNFITAGANSSGVLNGTLDQSINPTTGNIVNFPLVATDGAGMSIGYAAQKLGKNLLSVQLTSLQKEGKLNILSSPTITTLDNKTAIIESGKEVPYQTKDDDGKTEIAYKRAVVRMEVTPHVIAGKELRLDISTTKDDIDWANTVDGNPAVNTKQAETSVVLFDGHTTVIGGLSKETKTGAQSGVPFLQDIPFLGYLFKGFSNQIEMEEILVFITPYILEEIDEARVGDEFQSESMYLPKPPKRVRFKP